MALLMIKKFFCRRKKQLKRESDWYVKIVGISVKLDLFDYLSVIMCHPLLYRGASFLKKSQAVY